VNINDTRLEQLFVAQNVSVEYEPAPVPEIDRLEDYKRFQEEVNETRGIHAGSESRRPYFKITKKKHPVAYSQSFEHVSN